MAADLIAADFSISPIDYCIPRSLFVSEAATDSSVIDEPATDDLQNEPRPREPDRMQDEGMEETNDDGPFQMINLSLNLRVMPIEQENNRNGSNRGNRGNGSKRRQRIQSLAKTLSLIKETSDWQYQYVIRGDQSRVHSYRLRSNSPSNNSSNSQLTRQHIGLSTDLSKALGSCHRDRVSLACIPSKGTFHLRVGVSAPTASKASNGLQPNSNDWNESEWNTMGFATDGINIKKPFNWTQQTKQASFDENQQQQSPVSFITIPPPFTSLRPRPFQYLPKDQVTNNQSGSTSNSSSSEEMLEPVDTFPSVAIPSMPSESHAESKDLFSLTAEAIISNGFFRAYASVLKKIFYPLAYLQANQKTTDKRTVAVPSIGMPRFTEFEVYLPVGRANSVDLDIAVNGLPSIQTKTWLIGEGAAEDKEQETESERSEDDSDVSDDQEFSASNLSASGLSPSVLSALWSDARKPSIAIQIGHTDEVVLATKATTFSLPPIPK